MSFPTYEDTIVVVPWHQQKVLDEFIHAWGLNEAKDAPVWFEQDTDKSGCAITKNMGVENAIREGAKTIVILDSDCHPSTECKTLDELIDKHQDCLGFQQVDRFKQITTPPSRGTPYLGKTMAMPVAGSMGYWLGVGDYDGIGQLVYGAKHPMEFYRGTIFGQMFPWSGMNVAFNAEWWPYPKFINLNRWDDIFSGYIFQKRAYDLGYCFNLGGPLVTHSRQSNVFRNLKDEAKYLYENEILWCMIASHPNSNYEELLALIPK